MPSPFDDIRALIAAMPGPDQYAAATTRARLAALADPAGPHGRLGEIAVWLAAWQGRSRPQVGRPQVALFASSHGLVAGGVSGEPGDLTARRVAAFGAGEAVINRVCLALDIGLKVFDLALDQPSGDITVAPALSERDCAATMAFGMEAVAGTDLLCLGDTGAGAATVAAALSLALFGGDAADWVGTGPGAARRSAAVATATSFHAGELADPLEALRRVGGREIAAMAGAIVAARHNRVPVVLDGLPAAAAAAVLHQVDPRAVDHCLFAHNAAEPGHARLTERLNARPLLDLGLSAGEGTGAALAAALVRVACALQADAAS